MIVGHQEDDGLRTYHVKISVYWTDPTQYKPTDRPVYWAKVKSRIGEHMLSDPSEEPKVSGIMPIKPGQEDEIRVSFRASNFNLSSDWSPWIGADNVNEKTQPLAQIEGRVEITPIGRQV